MVHLYAYNQDAQNRAEMIFFRKRDVVDTSTCITCSSVPACPVCGDGEECAMTTQTCEQCPTTYCTNLTTTLTTTSNPSSSSDSSHSSNSSHTAKIGGIAGGVAAFIFIVLAVLLYFVYKKWYKKKYPNGFFYYYEEEEDEDKEAFVSDQNENEGMRARRMSQSTLGTVANSVLTKASNVINITYIPGVTIRSNNPRLISSRQAVGPSNASISRNSNKAISIYSKETYFSDLDNASIHGGNVATRGGAPRLINIDEDSYDFDKDLQIDDPSHNNNNFKTTVNKSGYFGGLQHNLIEEEEEDDDDEDNYYSTSESRTNSKATKSSTPTSSKSFNLLFSKSTPLHKPLGQDLDKNSNSSDSDDSDMADSDEENIEFLTTQHQQGRLDLSNRRSSVPFNIKQHDTSSGSNSSNTNTYNSSTHRQPSSQQIVQQPLAVGHYQNDIPLQLFADDTNGESEPKGDDDLDDQGDTGDFLLQVDLDLQPQQPPITTAPHHAPSLLSVPSSDADNAGTAISSSTAARKEAYNFRLSVGSQLNSPFDSPFD